MASNINYANINENFPVAGQDNDTQVFRDNFDTIKNSLSSAKSEVTDLQNNTAKLNVDNDFDGNTIANAVFQDIKNLKFDGGSLSAVSPATSIDSEINYGNGIYQVYRFGSNSNITITGLPEDNYAKMVIELYGDGEPSVPAGSFVEGTSYTITTAGDTVWTNIGAANNNPGTTFTATGAGAGSGIAKQVRLLSLVTVGGITIKKSANWPANLLVSSSANPVIIEVWRHTPGTIFANYLGLFA